MLQIADRIKADVTTAMKAGERERVAALRLVLSELQKAAKEGDADEVAVLRRERKRRRRPRPRTATRAVKSRRRRRPTRPRLIEAYLPAALSDDDSTSSCAREWRRPGRRPRATWGR